MCWLTKANIMPPVIFLLAGGSWLLCPRAILSPIDHAPGAGKPRWDGRQGVTALYGIVRGEPPAFCDGDTSRFLDLYFNLQPEEFAR